MRLSTMFSPRREAIVLWVIGVPAMTYVCGYLLWRWCALFWGDTPAGVMVLALWLGYLSGWIFGRWRGVSVGMERALRDGIITQRLREIREPQQ